MKKILKYTAIFSVLASVVSTSCIKEVLPQGSSISTDQATSAAGAVKSMTGAIANYAANANWSSNDIHSFYGYPSLCVFREAWSNDETAADTTYDWYQSMRTNTSISATYVVPQIYWLIYTKLIALSNDIIRMYPNLDEVDNANRAFLGAAYAYRALCMIDMAQTYEFKPNKYTSKESVVGLTVPYLHENMTVDYARSNPRLTKEEYLVKIYESLDAAIAMFLAEDGTVFSPTTDKTLPDLAVAYGLYARAKLYEGDYAAAKEFAAKALTAGSFSPLTKEQWTNANTGFNDADSQTSWMLCTRTSSESTVVKTGIINFPSHMSCETIWGYGGPGAGCFPQVDAHFYSQIPDTDFRKLSWKAPAGHALESSVTFIPAQGDADQGYPGPSALPTYASVKFRPATGDALDYLNGAAADFCMMRMEEMKFIIAECDARLTNSAASLVEIVKTRNPEYTCTLTNNDLLREVFFQKRIEFWGEGIMFFDYKRCPELLQINRGYSGTNHPELARFNCDGLAPWFNIPINGYEAQDNKALTETNNPDSSGSVEVWIE